MGNELLTGKAGETLLLLGNEAIARGALEAGVRCVTCYPGTPSSEVPDTFFRLSQGAPYYFEYSVNEKVALEVAGGATLAGLPCLVTMYQAARDLRESYRVVNYKVKKHGIDPKRFTPGRRG